MTAAKKVYVNVSVVSCRGDNSKVKARSSLGRMTLGVT